MTTYTIVKKNKKRDSAPWYLVVRDSGTRKDINLETSSKKDAEAELMRVKLAAAELNGVGDPLDALAVRRKRLSEAVIAPGGIVDRWADDMRVRGFAQGSITRYVKAVKVLLKKEPIGALTPQKVISIVAATANLKNNTRHGYCNALKCLFTYLRRPDLVEVLPKVKSEQTDRPWWTPEQMQEIIYAVRSNKPERTIEYKDYFGIMAAIGSRQEETAQLRWCDLKDGVLYFRPETTKCRKPKVVPIPYGLWAQIEVRRPPIKDPIVEERNESPMFPYISRACQATRYAVLARTLKRLGLKGGLHTFRHSVSMNLYKKSADLKAVSQILGHSPQVALQYYQNSRAIDDLRKIVDDEWG